MNITVYLGANEGNDPTLKSAVRELGTWIGKSGNALVYGGSKAGLMGELAESVLMAGGEVTGVEPQFFIDAGFEYDAITRLIVTKDMPERKTKMIELGVHRLPRRDGHARGNFRGDVLLRAGDAQGAVHTIQFKRIL